VHFSLGNLSNHSFWCGLSKAVDKFSFSLIPRSEKQLTTGFVRYMIKKNNSLCTLRTDKFTQKEPINHCLLTYATAKKKLFKNEWSQLAVLLNSSRLAENGTSREKEITLVQCFFCDYFSFLVWNITSELKLHKYFLLGFNTYDKQHFISAMKLAELKKKLRDGLVLSCNQPWLSKVTNQKRLSSIVFGGSPVIRKVTVI